VSTAIAKRVRWMSKPGSAQQTAIFAPKPAAQLLLLVSLSSVLSHRYKSTLQSKLKSLQKSKLDLHQPVLIAPVVWSINGWCGGIGRDPREKDSAGTEFDFEPDFKVAADLGDWVLGSQIFLHIRFINPTQFFS
jgi:hypothetical protein